MIYRVLSGAGLLLFALSASCLDSQEHFGEILILCLASFFLSMISMYMAEKGGRHAHR